MGKGTQRQGVRLEGRAQIKNCPQEDIGDFPRYRFPAGTASPRIESVVLAGMADMITEAQMPLSNRITDQVTYKAPGQHKIIAEAWNPQSVLLAVALSNGQVIVKSAGWKTCWRKNIGDEPVPSRTDYQRSTKPNEGTISSICWSPNGEILLVATSTEHVFFLRGSNGKVCFVLSPGVVFKEIFWIRIPLENSICFHKNPSYRDSMLNSFSFGFHEDGIKDCGATIEEMQYFFLNELPSSFGQSVLVGFTDEGKIQFFLAGILFVKEISGTGFYSSPRADEYSLRPVDFSISNRLHLHVVYQVNEYDVPVYNYDKRGEDPPPTDQILGSTTFFVDFDLGWDQVTISSMLLCAYYYSQVLYFTTYIREMLRYSMATLEEDTTMFFEKFVVVCRASYRLHASKCGYLFEDMFNHISTRQCQRLYVEGIRKIKPQTIAQIESYVKKLQYVKKGLHFVNEALSTVIPYYKELLRTVTTNLELKSYPPENHKEHPLFDRLTDFVVAQNLCDHIQALTVEKIRGFSVMYTYLMQAITVRGDSFSECHIDFNTLKTAELKQFLWSTLAKTGATVPPQLPEFVPVPPKTQNTTDERRELLAERLKPLTAYPLPPYVPHCPHDCVHNAKNTLERIDESNQEQRPPTAGLESDPSDFPHNDQHSYCVHLWQNERNFDFFLKFFPEYGTAGLPPSDIYAQMVDVEKSFTPDDDDLFREFVNPNLAAHPLVDSVKLLRRTVMRPTVMLATMPLMNVDATIREYFGDHHPTVFGKMHLLEKCHPIPAKIFLRSVGFLEDMETACALRSSCCRMYNRDLCEQAVVVFMRNRFLCRTFVFCGKSLPKHPPFDNDGGEMNLMVEKAILAPEQFLTIGTPFYDLTLYDAAIDNHGIIFGVGATGQLGSSTCSENTLSNSPPSTSSETETELRLFWCNIFGKSLQVDRDRIKCGYGEGCRISVSRFGNLAIVDNNQQSALWVSTVNAPAQVRRQRFHEGSELSSQGVADRLQLMTQDDSFRQHEMQWENHFPGMEEFLSEVHDAYLA